LLRARRVDESIVQFEEILRRNPDASRAREGLQMALRARAAGY